MTNYPRPKIDYPPDSLPTTTRFQGMRRRWQVLARLVQQEGWTFGVEIGTADGTCTEALLLMCPDLHMITVDPWEPQPENDGPEDWTDWPHDEHERQARTRLRSFGPRCRIFKGYSKRAVDLVQDASLDFVFLDGDHSERGVRDDIAAWRRRVRPGGMILLHDINWQGVRAAADALLPGYWIGPDNLAGATV